MKNSKRTLLPKKHVDLYQIRDSNDFIKMRSFGVIHQASKTKHRKDGKTISPLPRPILNYIDLANKLVPVAPLSGGALQYVKYGKKKQ